MAATATASSTGVRYAPEDPSLPKPWRGLVDGNTGYVYFWNPDTNVTQYERPVAPSLPSSVPSQKSLSSSVQKPSHGRGYDNDKNMKVSNGGPLKVASGAGNYQTLRSKSDYSQNDTNAKTSTGHGSYASNGADSSLSADSFRHRHDITVTGDQMPRPFTSFDDTGFPSEILREVRYLLQEEPNVVHCAVLLWRLACVWSALIGGLCEGLSESSKHGGTSVGNDSVCPLV